MPGLTTAALPVSLLLASRQRGFLRAWGIGFALAITLDAWLTGILFPDSMAIAVAFVILGDLRVFALGTWDGRPRSLARALGLALVTPAASQAMRVAFPRIAATPRLTYLVYEVLFVVVLAIWRRRAGRFAAVHYGLWIAIDGAILAGVYEPYALALRRIPDVLYYVVFVPWVLASRSSRSPRS